MVNARAWRVELDPFYSSILRFFSNPHRYTVKDTRDSCILRERSRILLIRSPWQGSTRTDVVFRPSVNLESRFVQYLCFEKEIPTKFDVFRRDAL